MTYNSTLPGPGDQCFCGSYGACRCQPEPDVEQHYEDSYQAGFEACQADGYSERPMTIWIYQTWHRARWCTEARRLVYTMTTKRFSELTWRHQHASAAAYGRWFERSYGFNLESYVAGYDDAGAGLPSEVSDPERHRIYAEAMDAFEPRPVLYDQPIGPMPVPAETDDWMPF